ncbi:MAG: tail fiber domain-containing protein, partial [Chitinophagia bacterium]|nr:tail fiber domain-containing protein [Chitinophagia bacterium]
DERIKTNIHNINSDDCDTILSLLQPKTYNYIDNIHESRSRYGLIAQEVKDILPGLINYKSDYIPNIMCKAEFIDKNKFRLNNQQVTLNMNNDIRIHYSKSETNTEETLYCKIINKEISVNDTIYTIDKDKLEDKIFIYGTLVDDFHVLNYDQLIPILITGYQHQKDIIRTLSSKLDDLQNQINALK